MDRLVVKRDDDTPPPARGLPRDGDEGRQGLVTVATLGASADAPTSDETLSTSYACPDCGTSLAEITPRLFSFNSPFGACPTCGLGSVRRWTGPSRAGRVVVDPRRGDRALQAGFANWRLRQIEHLAKVLKFSIDVPWSKLPKDVREIILHGSGDREIKWKWKSEKGEYAWSSAFKGLVPILESKYKEVESEDARAEMENYMSASPCPDCKGRRLKPEALAVLVDSRSIDTLTALTLEDAQAFFTKLKPTAREMEIAGKILKEIRDRLGFLNDVGIGYLSLARASATLSGGEAQRIRLATQIGSKLMGVLYVLDEPSIGLHAKDNRKLIDTLVAMRDLGNTVVVVEHDEETIRLADRVVDLGPGAGIHGGEIVGEGMADELAAFPRSLTGKYLSGALRIEVPKARRKGTGKTLAVVGATENNLKDLTVKFLSASSRRDGRLRLRQVDARERHPLSRGGASFHEAGDRPGAHRKLEGLGTSTRSSTSTSRPSGARRARTRPRTRTSSTPSASSWPRCRRPDARLRAGPFSFNVKGGRCENCGGGGQIAIEMHFLPDIYVTCDICGGKRYNRETLEVRYKGLNIADVLALTAEQAAEVFANVPSIKTIADTLNDVGLGYIQLGQPATTLSGGEAQRVKLARELARRATGRTLYILDEPTTGLHFDDVKKLLSVLHALVERGNTVIVIEHNLDVVKTADWVGSQARGGARGGELVAEGLRTGRPKRPLGHREVPRAASRAALRGVSARICGYVITGFNTDVKHADRVYHVQTEDRGVANPVVESLVYVGGEILLSKKSPYKDLITGDRVDEKALREMMDLQHRRVIEAVRRGRLDTGKIGDAPADWADDTLPSTERSRPRPSRPSTRSSRCRPSPAGRLQGRSAAAREAGPAAASPRDRLRRCRRLRRPHRRRPAHGRRRRRPSSGASPAASGVPAGLRFHAEAAGSGCVCSTRSSSTTSPQRPPRAPRAVPDVRCGARLGREGHPDAQGHDVVSRRSSPGVHVSIRVVSTVRPPQILFRGVTAGDGCVSSVCALPDIGTGNAALIIAASSPLGNNEIKQLIKKKRGARGALEAPTAIRYIPPPIRGSRIRDMRADSSIGRARDS